MSRLEAARPVQRSSTGRMAHPGRQDVTQWPQFCKNAGLDKSRRRGGGYNAQLLLTVVLFAVILTCSTAQELRRESTSLPTYIAGSQLWTRWGERGDVKHTVAQLGGVQQCSEGINARVDSEFLEDAMLGSCRQEAAGYDVAELLQPSEKLAVPSREQTTKLCRSEACTAWLSLAVNTSWLPECRYRQSQTSFRSLAETLLRIRDDLVATGVEREVKAPNASLFREFYELNQLVNVLSENNDNPLNEISLPDMQVARRMSEEEGLRDQPITAAEHPESVSDSTADNIRSLLHINGSSNPSDSANLDSTGNSSSIRDSSSDSKLDPSDDSDFTNRGVGTHASSTSTTTELTPSYAYVIGVWVLFNGSYFFLMRKK